MDWIFQAISTLGFPICSAVALGYALLQVSKRYEAALLTHATQLTAISESSNAALSANTTSNRKLVEALEAAKPVCQFKGTP